MPRTGATLSHGQITAVLRKTGRRDIEAETVLSRGTRLAHRARDGTRQHQWPGAHIIGIGIHIGIDQPMLCIQLMNMCIMSIICCDIVLTTVVDVSLDTSGTSVRAGSTPNGRPVRSMALCASVGADVHGHRTEATETMSPFAFARGVGSSCTRIRSSGAGLDASLVCVLEICSISAPKRIGDSWWGMGSRKQRRKPKLYPSDLTDAQWELIAPMVPVPSAGRPPIHSRRRIVDAILYVNRTGCSWRQLPHDFPK